MTAQWIFTIVVLAITLAVFVWMEFGVVRQANQRADKAERRAMDAEVKTDRAEARNDAARAWTNELLDHCSPSEPETSYGHHILAALDDTPEQP